MNEEHPSATRARAVPTRAMIGFRLDDSSNRLLAKRAAKMGISVHALAKLYVLDALEANAERQQMLARLENLHLGVLGLRSDLATSIKAILTNVGSLDVKEVDAWIRANFH
jgi:hypothetical protein